MKYLFAGNQSEERFRLLLSFTSIRSADIVTALGRHLVKGESIELSSLMADVPKENVKRALDKLEIVAGNIELVKEIDFTDPPRILVDKT